MKKYLLFIYILYLHRCLLAQEPTPLMYEQQELINELKKLIELHYPDTIQTPNILKSLDSAVFKYQNYDNNFYEYLKVINNDLGKIDPNIHLYFSTSLMSGYSWHQYKRATWKNISKEQKKSIIEKFGEPMFINRKWLKSSLNQLNLASTSHYVLPHRIHKNKKLYNDSHRGHKSFLGKQRTYDQSIYNFGFEEINILEGNIGYLKVSYWSDPNYIDTPILNHVLGMLIHSKSMIIDLRETGWGSVDMIPLLCSYFMPKKSEITLGRLFNKFTKKEKELKTFRKLKGITEHFDQRPIYILTSNKTIGISEFLIYVLKKYRNATIIGEHTTGSALTVEDFKIISPTYIKMPNQIIIPNDGETWHRKGISPDIFCNKEYALDSAWKYIYASAIKEERLEEKRVQMQQYLDYKIAINQKINFNYNLQEYEGRYEYEKKIILENNTLYLEDFTNKKLKLIPNSKNEFLVDYIFSREQKMLKSNSVLSIPIQIIKVRFEKDLETDIYDLILIYNNNTFGTAKKL